MNTLSRRKAWAVKVLTALVILPFTMSAIMKLVHAAPVVEGFSRMGIPLGDMAPIGIIELTCLVLYLIPRTTMLGTLLLTGYLGGATLANIVNGSDFTHALIIGLLVWAGAWLRVPEFRTLVPFRGPLFSADMSISMPPVRQYAGVQVNQE